MSRATAGRLGALARLARLAPADRTLLCEAFVLTGLASAALRFLPFKMIGKIATRPLTARMADPAARAALADKVRWAVAASARRSPWRALCFEQGLAAQVMLRRRGVASTLYFGARRDDASEVTAHVWVRDQDRDVIGCDEASRFAVLASWPHAA
jgi:hypothetical protein